MRKKVIRYSRKLKTEDFLSSWSRGICPPGFTELENIKKKKMYTLTADTNFENGRRRTCIEKYSGIYRQTFEGPLLCFGYSFQNIMMYCDKTIGPRGNAFLCSRATRKRCRIMSLKFNPSEKKQKNYNGGKQAEYFVWFRIFFFFFDRPSLTENQTATFKTLKNSIRFRIEFGVSKGSSLNIV